MSKLQYSFVNKISSCGGGSCKLYGVPNVLMGGTGDRRQRFAWIKGGVKDENCIFLQNELAG